VEVPDPRLDYLYEKIQPQGARAHCGHVRGYRWSGQRRIGR
jgi:hypothetical protein